MSVSGILTDREYLVLQAETATGWAVHDSGATSHGVPLYEGEYGVELDDPFREQPIVNGDQEATFIEQDLRNLAGPLRVPMYPESAKLILDWSLLRTSNELSSKTLTHVSPDIETRRHHGMKVDRIRLSAANAGDLVAALDLVGRYETSPNDGTSPAAPTMPSIEAYIFAQSRFLLSRDGGSTEIEPTSVEEVSLDVANRLVRGPAREDRTDDDKSMTISYLLAGKREVTGSVTALYDSSAYGDMQRGRLSGSFRWVLAHKSGGATEVAGSASAGTSVSVEVDDSSDFEVGEVVRFESSAGVLKCAGKISAIDDGTHITIATLEKDLASGDLVYGKALSFYCPNIRVSGLPKRRTRSDLVRVTLNFRAFADAGGNLLEYIAEE